MISPLKQLCDNLSVGVLITDADGRYLMFDRTTFPAGVAPVAGHVDVHGEYGPDGDRAAAAARTEVSEEVGLTVTGLSWLHGQWRTNRCRRPLNQAGVVGHFWQIFRATVSGEVKASVRETHNTRWLSIDQVQDLALRTAAYAANRFTDAEFDAEPGLEPVWCAFLTELGVIDLDADDLARIDSLAAHATPRPTR